MIVIVFAKKGITMKNIFQKSSSNWVKYDKYEWRTATNGKCYITPSADAKLSIYNPIRDYEKLVLTAKTIEYYNLDVIISVGYRVKSHRGTQFRI